MNLLGYGTSEGVTKEWDTRGRGRKPTEHAFPAFRGTTLNTVNRIIREGGVQQGETPFRAINPRKGEFTSRRGLTYITTNPKVAAIYAVTKRNYALAKPGRKFVVPTEWGGYDMIKPSDGPAPKDKSIPAIVTMALPKSFMDKMEEDSESPSINESYTYEGKIPIKYIKDVYVLDADTPLGRGLPDPTKWKKIDWKKGVQAAEETEPTVTVYFVLDDVSNLGVGDIKAEALFRGVNVLGFTGPEEEFVRATMSRVPPELLTNVKAIIAAPWLGVKHGRFLPDTKIIYLNPKNARARARVGEGPGWINHGMLTTIHEVMA